MSAMNSQRPRTSFSSGICPADPTRVVPADIERLDVIHALLAELNDPRASAVTIAPFIAAFPPLRARIARTFEMRRPNSHGTSIASQIVCLGNREVEAVLLELLEDLTMLRADLLEQTKDR
jgi:hypothetical protein